MNNIEKEQLLGANKPNDPEKQCLTVDQHESEFNQL